MNGTVDQARTALGVYEQCVLDEARYATLGPTQYHTVDNKRGNVRRLVHDSRLHPSDIILSAVLGTFAGSLVFSIRPRRAYSRDA